MTKQANVTSSYPKFIRAISLMLIASFSVGEMAHAAPVNATGVLGPNPSSIRFTGSFAKISDVYRGSDKRMLIHIQDAHTNTGAERNMASALEELVTRYKINTVFIEGGTRDDSLNFLRSVASRENREKVAKKYLAMGELNGAEYLSLASDHDFKIWGVEDGKLYEKSLKSYAKAVSGRDAVLAYLDEVRQRVQSLKRQSYPKDILAFDDFLVKFRAKEKNFTDYHALLSAYAEKYGVSLLGFPNFVSLKDLKAQEDKIDFAKANREQEELAGLISSESFAAHVEKLKSGKITPLPFYEAMLGDARSKGVDVSKYPQFAAYVDYLRATGSIRMDRFLKETEILEEAIFQKALTDEDVFYLHRVSDYLTTLKNLFSLQASREEFDQYSVLQKDIRFSTPVILAFINRKLYDLGNYGDVVPTKTLIDENKDQIEAFYRTTEERDEIFLKKSLEKMQKDGIETAVLITGGYHTQGLKDRMKQKNISYAVITPAVTEETNIQRYEKILLSRGSLDASSKQAIEAGSQSHINTALVVEAAPVVVRNVTIDLEAAEKTNPNTRTKRPLDDRKQGGWTSGSPGTGPGTGMPVILNTNPRQPVSDRRAAAKLAMSTRQAIILTLVVIGAAGLGGYFVVQRMGNQALVTAPAEADVYPGLTADDDRALERGIAEGWQYFKKGEEAARAGRKEEAAGYFRLAAALSARIEKVRPQWVTVAKQQQAAAAKSNDPFPLTGRGGVTPEDAGFLKTYKSYGALYEVGAAQWMRHAAFYEIEQLGLATDADKAAQREAVLKLTGDYANTQIFDPNGGFLWWALGGLRIGSGVTDADQKLIDARVEEAQKGRDKSLQKDGTRLARIFAAAVFVLFALTGELVAEPYKFFDKKADPKTGMTKSFYSSKDSRQPLVEHGSATFDMGLLSLYYPGTHGPKIVDTYTNGQRGGSTPLAARPVVLARRGEHDPDGSIYLNVLRVSGFDIPEWWNRGWDWQAHVGPQAWLVTGGTLSKKLEFAQGRLDGILSLMDKDGRLRMGPKGQPKIKDGIARGKDLEFYDVVSTENMQSAIMAAGKVNQVKAVKKYADARTNMYEFMMENLYDAKEKAFHRGMRYDGKEWKKDGHDEFASDTAYWAPFDLMMKDARLGKTDAERLTTIGEIAEYGEKNAGVYEKEKLVGISFGAKAKARKAVWIEGTNYYAIRAMRISREWERLGDKEKAAYWRAKYDHIMAVVKTYEKSIDGEKGLPYAVTPDGEIYTGPTFHGWNCPNAEVSLSSTITYNMADDMKDGAKDPMELDYEKKDGAKLAAKNVARKALSTALANMRDAVMQQYVIDVSFDGAGGFSPVSDSYDDANRQIVLGRPVNRGKTIDLLVNIGKMKRSEATKIVADYNRSIKSGAKLAQGDLEIPTKQISGHVPTINSYPQTVNVSSLRSAADARALVAAKPLVIKGYLRGADAGGSSIDLLGFQNLLNKPGATQLDEITSTVVIASSFPVQLTVELAADPDVIEYVMVKKKIDPSSGNIVEERILHSVRKSDFVLDANGQTPKGQVDAFAYYMSRVGLWGFRAVFETLEPIAEAGGLGRSSGSNALFLYAASMLSDAGLSKADIQAESVYTENDVFGGFTGGQESAATIWGGANQLYWMGYLRNAAGERIYPYSVYKLPLLSSGTDLAEFGSHFVFVQPGLEYVNGKPQDTRTASLINTMWTHLLEDRDPVGFPLHEEKLALARKSAEGLANGDWQAVIQALNRHREIRDLLQKRWFELATMDPAQQAVQYPYAKKYTQMLQTDPILQKYATQFVSQGKDIRQQSLYSLTSEGLISQLEQKIGKKSTDPDFPIGIFLPGAGGPGTTAMLVAQDPVWLNQILEELGYAEFNDPKEVVRVTTGTGLLKGRISLKVGGPIEILSSPDGVTAPADGINAGYDENTGEFGIQASADVRNQALLSLPRVKQTDAAKLAVFTPREEALLTQMGVVGLDREYVAGLLYKYRNGNREGEYVPSAKMTPSERLSVLGRIDYSDIQTPENAEAAKKAVVKTRLLAGGLGSSMKMKRYKLFLEEQRLEKAHTENTIDATEYATKRALFDRWQEAETQYRGRVIDARTFNSRVDAVFKALGLTLGAKGTELIFDFTVTGKDIQGHEIQVPVQASVAEAKLVEALLHRPNFAGTIYLPLVDKNSKVSYDALYDQIYLPDLVDQTKTKKRTYREVALEIGGFEFAPMVPEVPIPVADPDTHELADFVDADGRIITAPGGHGRAGVYMLLGAYQSPVRTDGLYDFDYFVNSDAFNGTPNNYLVGHMIRQNIPIAIVSTVATPLDAKGGKIGKKDVHVSGGVKAIMGNQERAQAPNKAEFEKTGIEPGYGDVGEQEFNTNGASVNRTLLSSILQDLVSQGIITEAQLAQIVAPDVIPNAKVKEIKVDQGGTPAIVKRLIHQIEGAMVSTLINLNDFFETHPDPRVQDTLRKHGVTSLVTRVIHTTPDERTDFFTPIKSTFDFWFQNMSDYYSKDTREWRLRDTKTGQKPPLNRFDNAFYTDVFDMMIALGRASTQNVASIEILSPEYQAQADKVAGIDKKIEKEENEEAKAALRDERSREQDILDNLRTGIVFLKDAELKGHVRITSHRDEYVDLNDARYAGQLPRNTDNNLLLQDVQIEIDAAGNLTVTPYAGARLAVADAAKPDGAKLSTAPQRVAINYVSIPSAATDDTRIFINSHAGMTLPAPKGLHTYRLPTITFSQPQPLADFPVTITLDFGMPADVEQPIQRQIVSSPGLTTSRIAEIYMDELSQIPTTVGGAGRRVYETAIARTYARIDQFNAVQGKPALVVSDDSGPEVSYVVTYPSGIVAQGTFAGLRPGHIPAQVFNPALAQELRRTFSSIDVRMPYAQAVRTAADRVAVRLNRSADSAGLVNHMQTHLDGPRGRMRVFALQNRGFNPADANEMMRFMFATMGPEVILAVISNPNGLMSYLASNSYNGRQLAAYAHDPVFRSIFHDAVHAILTQGFVRHRNMAIDYVTGAKLAAQEPSGAKLVTAAAVQVSPAYRPDAVYREMGLQVTRTTARLIQGPATTDLNDLFSDPRTTATYYATVAQAVAAYPHKGAGDNGKAADGNAVTATDKVIRDYVLAEFKAGRRTAVIVFGDEGAKDHSASLGIGDVYYVNDDGQIVLRKFTDAGEGRTLENALASLRDFVRSARDKFTFQFYAGDGVEGTSILVHREKNAGATSIASFLDIDIDWFLSEQGYLSSDALRIHLVAGDFDASDLHEVNAYSLPSEIVHALAEKRGVTSGDIRSKYAFFALRRRQADLGEQPKEKDLAEHHPNDAVFNDVEYTAPFAEIRRAPDGNALPAMFAASGIARIIERDRIGGPEAFTIFAVAKNHGRTLLADLVSNKNTENKGPVRVDQDTQPGTYTEKLARVRAANQALKSAEADAVRPYGMIDAAGRLKDVLQVTGAVSVSIITTLPGATYGTEMEERFTGIAADDASLTVKTYLSLPGGVDLELETRLEPVTSGTTVPQLVGGVIKDFRKGAAAPAEKKDAAKLAATATLVEREPRVPSRFGAGSGLLDATDFSLRVGMSNQARIAVSGRSLYQVLMQPTITDTDLVVASVDFTVSAAGAVTATSSAIPQGAITFTALQAKRVFDGRPFVPAQSEAYVARSLGDKLIDAHVDFWGTNAAASAFTGLPEQITESTGVAEIGVFVPLEVLKNVVDFGKTVRMVNQLAQSKGLQLTIHIVTPDGRIPEDIQAVLAKIDSGTSRRLAVKIEAFQADGNLAAAAIAAIGSQKLLDGKARAILVAQGSSADEIRAQVGTVDTQYHKSVFTSAVQKPEGPQADLAYVSFGKIFVATLYQALGLTDRIPNVGIFGFTQEFIEGVGLVFLFKMNINKDLAAAKLAKQAEIAA